MKGHMMKRINKGDGEKTKKKRWGDEQEKGVKKGINTKWEEMRRKEKERGEES